jgi:hypothetical protein
MVDWMDRGNPRRELPGTNERIIAGKPQDNVERSLGF